MGNDTLNYSNNNNIYIFIKDINARIINLPNHLDGWHECQYILYMVILESESVETNNPMKPAINFWISVNHLTWEY